MPGENYTGNRDRGGSIWILGGEFVGWRPKKKYQNIFKNVIFGNAIHEQYAFEILLL